MSDPRPPEIGVLLHELGEARAAFLAAIEDVEPALMDAPGLVGEWSGRQLLGHIAYWTAHAADALDAAARGTAAEFDREDLDVDRRNADVAAADAETPLLELREREARAYERLRELLERAEPAWLEERVSYGDSLPEVVRDDGSDHYREHAADLRAWFDGADDEADEDEEGQNA